MPNEVSPCDRSGQAIGDRSRASNDSHQCVGRYGCTTANCGTLSDTSLASASTMMAAIAPIGCSVNAEIASPIAASAAIAAVTYRATSASRSKPAPIEMVVPESSVTGPTGNSAAPVTSAATVTTAHAARQKITSAVYLIPSSLVRPAGMVSRYRSVPWPASPATESPATTATASGST